MKVQKMKRLYTLGFSGLVLGAAVIGYNLQASEPAVAEVDQTADAGLVKTAQAEPEITVYKSPSCSCCADWVEHVDKHGFAVKVETVDNLQAIKNEYDVPREMASCHTAVIDGFVVEGHVPANDIKEYLERRKVDFGDKSIGIAVPGMVQGSPGMETGRKESYAVLAFTADGESRVVETYDNY